MPDRMTPRRALFAALLAILLIGADAPSDAPEPAWREGPIRYILLVQEDKGYARLATDADRTAFIERFWAALDPTQGTAENERRTEFWKRVEEADRLFPEDMNAGWRTDRGRFYILMGPPDQRDRLGTTEQWKYVAMPNPDGDPEVSISFHRNLRGEFHVGNSKLVYWDPSGQTEGPAAGETFLGVRAKNGAVEMMKGRFRMAGLEGSAVQADFITAPLDYRLRYDFYRVRRDMTRVVATVALPAEQFRGAAGQVEPPDMMLSVTFNEMKKGSAAGSITAKLQPVAGPSAADRPMLLQGSFTIAPGPYQGSAIILDRKSHRGIVRSESLEAPDFGRRLALSSLAVGRLRDDLHPAGPDGAVPSDSGAPLLIPEPGPELHQGDTLLLAYEVYNARQGAGSKPDLDVEYQFLVTGGSAPRPVGKPIAAHHQSSESLAWSVPVRGWPAGGFRVRVRVKDNLSGETAEREADFGVAAPGSSAR